MDSEQVDAIVSRALEHQRAGDDARASNLYKGLIRRRHVSPRLYTNFGVLLYQSGDRGVALDLFEKALSLDPNYADAWHNLWVDADAHTADTVIRISSAIEILYPENAQAKVNAARGCLAKGEAEAAKSLLEQILATHPNDEAILELIAKCCLQLGDIDSATGYLLYLLSIDPGDAFATTELAEIALKTGDSESALQILNSGLEHNPNNHAILFQVARYYQSGGLINKAIETYKRSLKEAPDTGNIIANLAYCYAEIGEVSEFLRLYEEILSQDSATPESLVPLAFICSTLGKDYIIKLRQYSELIWEKRRNRQHEQPRPATADQTRLPTTAMGSICPPISRAKRRIGVLTGDLGIHVVSSFLASFLLNYSKDILEVEVISNKWRNDVVAERLASSVDRCISIASFTENAARAVLKERNYDVIIETSGFTSGSAIFLLDERCAPAQCHWIGYHASTFLPTMDYFIGDSILTPDSLQDQFSEKLAGLPRAWLAATPFTAIPQARQKGANEDVVIGSFSQIAKLTEETLLMWAQVLARAPHAKLMLKDKFVGDEKIQLKIAMFMASHNISEDRILFEPRTADWFQHMALYNQLDLALDTSPWSSATTAFDALSMGTPLISLLGQTAAGRMSSSALYHCGRREWIANSRELFVSKCLNVIDNVQTHRKNRLEYQSEILRSELYDGAAMARAMQSFLLSI